MLGSNAQDANQAVRFAPQAWGVQFRPEFGPAFIDALVDVVADDIARSGRDPGTIGRSPDDMPKVRHCSDASWRSPGAMPRPAPASTHPVALQGRTLRHKQPAIMLVFPYRKLKPRLESTDPWNILKMPRL